MSEKTKLDQYRLDDAYAEGISASKETPPCELLPVKYYKNAELAESWVAGFRFGLRERVSESPDEKDS